MTLFTRIDLPNLAAVLAIAFAPLFLAPASEPATQPIHVADLAPQF
jgi:hypothetical protein